MHPTGPDVGPPNTTENAMTRLARSRAVVTAGFVLGTATAGLVLAPAASAAALSAPTAPTTVTPGTAFTVSGAGCEIVDEEYGAYVIVATDVEDADINVDVNEDGTWTSSILFPTGTSAGVHQIASGCETSYYGDPAAYPTIEVTVPAGVIRGVAANTPGVVSKTDSGATGKTAAPGQQVVRILTGFQPGEVVTLVMHSTPVTLGVFTADANGVVTATFTLPAGTAAGTHTLVFEGDMGTYFQEDITVAAATPVKAASSSGTLAYTGASVALPLGIGGALVLAGGGAMIASRRRNAVSSEA
jgi:hypothetical protein